MDAYAKSIKRVILIFLFFIPILGYSDIKEIAITIDDLPLVASKMNTPGNITRSTERFNRIIEAFKAYNVPATGFVIAGSIGKGQWPFLENFRNAGLMLGNHTYSHSNLNQTNADNYIADIDKADRMLSSVMTKPKYFRYPYLAEGNNKATKDKVHEYLTTHNYIVAPVTIDSKDFEFNEQCYHVPFRQREAYIYKLKPTYLNYIWKQTLRAENHTKSENVKQILLIHANLINSYLLSDILEMYKKNGYKFITLAEALKNPAPTLQAPIQDLHVDTKLISLVPSVTK